MGPVLRISGQGTLSVTLNGLTSDQTTLLTHIIRSTDCSAGIELSPLASKLAHLTGTSRALRHTARLIASSGSVVSDLSEKIDSLLDNYLRSDYKINCKGTVLDLSRRTHIMGILNVTPDSFSDGGLYAGTDKACRHAHDMVAAGADIIDIGGESTRPGAAPVSEEDELARIIPVIKRLSHELTVPLSVDTYKSTVARKAIEAGASLINDISGLRFSPDMARVAADHGAVVVIMHIKGTPRDMQQNPVYDDVVEEVIAWLEQGVEIAVQAGVDREKILIDPGIGFGKTIGHNLILLDRLNELRCLGRPIVLGTSRKKFIGAVLDLPVPEQRIDGTAATVALGIERGAGIIRVHDVARMAQVARMTDAIVRASTK